MGFLGHYSELLHRLEVARRFVFGFGEQNMEYPLTGFTQECGCRDNTAKTG